ncbi:MAG: di-heme-cytochrome C peroxidase [Acidobacteriota bacterium]
MRKIVLFLVCTLAVCAFAADPIYLEQNRDNSDRQWFYTTPQGSKLILYSWAMALELPNSETRWSATLDRFGFIPNATSNVNPDGLPVGVVRDDDHLGLTCAACHTGQLEYGGQAYRIDGGPTDADLYGFLADLGAAVNATATSGVSSPKFLRFAKAVLGDGDGPQARAQLYATLRSYNTYLTQFVKNSTPKVTWGPARTDAFGMIFNRVTSIDLKIPGNNRKPDAPVSYPFLWDTSWHNKVQWNGVAPNSFAVERLARNVGEVLGVFAEIDIKAPTWIPLKFWYPSSAKRLNQLDLEDRLADLRSPQWPASFPPLDAAKVSRGQAVYTGQCLSCHALATPGKHQNVTLTALNVVNTDPQMTVASANRTARTGVLEGVKSFLIFGPRLGATALAGTVTLNATVGAILSPVSLDTEGSTTPTPGANADTGDADRALLRSQLLDGPGTSKTDRPPSREDLETSLKAIAAQRQDDATTSAVFYKARPLDGIWATGPYLHNGSVPSLWDLLQPPASRPRTFYVGSREFDPVNVGMKPAQTPGAFLLDTAIVGNGNGGHVWGTTLSDEDRWAVIEYLKSL